MSANDSRTLYLPLPVHIHLRMSVSLSVILHSLQILFHLQPEHLSNGIHLMEGSLRSYCHAPVLQPGLLISEYQNTPDIHKFHSLSGSHRLLCMFSVPVCVLQWKISPCYSRTLQRYLPVPLNLHKQIPAHLSHCRLQTALQHRRQTSCSSHGRLRSVRP